MCQTERTRIVTHQFTKSTYKCIYTIWLTSYNWLTFIASLDITSELQESSARIFSADRFVSSSLILVPCLVWKRRLPYERKHSYCRSQSCITEIAFANIYNSSTSYRFRFVWSIFLYYNLVSVVLQLQLFKSKRHGVNRIIFCLLWPWKWNSLAMWYIIGK